MILLKKTYAEQLFHLALTLSLLHVNPDNYLGWGWHSQLALHNGDGWQLELLPATPITDYPYSNRKALIPLIEDLVRFDRYRDNTGNNNNDIQTYLLNIQNEQKTIEANQQQQQQQPNETTIQTPIPENRTFISEHTIDLDLFLNSDQFLESRSILEQNMADLNDYADLLPYAGLPQKDEPPELPIFSSSLDNCNNMQHSNLFNDMESIELGRGSENDSFPTTATVVKWSDILDLNAEGIKVEIKSEKSDRSINGDDEKNSTSGFSSAVELTEEESEIVEVLWKQDVDLGYSLEPLKLPDKIPKLSTSSNDTNDDDNEKLKILEEIKNEKESPEKELEDEWAGIQFTIDNETGEYIQHPLQLDDLLQDVLHVDSLTPDDSLDVSAVKIETENTTINNQNIKIREKEQQEKLKSDKILTNNNHESPDLEITADLSQIILGVDDANELDEFEMMIQSAGPFQHPRSSQSYGHGGNSYRQSYHQSRVPLSRAVSMEQRLQDIAHLFNPIPGMGVGMGVGDVASYPHYPSHPYSYQSTGPITQHAQFTHPHSHAAVLHNASLAELGAGQPHYGPNLGTAVSSSMHITNASHEADAGATGYKMDPDMMYYSNASSELNHTTDGFINSILNDEDLQLMDMGVNEGFYTMRMLESNATSNNSSVLGGTTSSGNHSNGLLGSTSMQTGLSALGPIGSTATTANALSGIGGDRLDASSDSAVSSMGSERVPSLSDGEWGDAGSDSAQDYHQRNSSKYGGPYDYSYSSRLPPDPVRHHPVAQKKHHMFGKRYFQEQSNLPSLPSHSTSSAQHPDLPIKYEYDPYGMVHHGSTGMPHNLDVSSGNPSLINKHLTPPELKYSCSLDFQRQSGRGCGGPSIGVPGNLHDIVNHNHTYTVPQNPGATAAAAAAVAAGAAVSPRPLQVRDKKQRRIDDEHLSRDEKRARSLNIPIIVNDIINLPMDEFNERLSKYDLSETQLSLIRDIRRRGKNKVAAQNCRKRKLDQIICLADEVNEVKKRKDRLCQERDSAISGKKTIMYKFSLLHKHVFQNLRDPDGNPYSQSQYSLQQSADGSIFLLPKDNNNKDSLTSNSSSSSSNSSNDTTTSSHTIQHLEPAGTDTINHQQSHSNQQQHHHHNHPSHQQQQQLQQQQQQQPHHQPHHHHHHHHHHHPHHHHHHHPHQKD